MVRAKSTAENPVAKGPRNYVSQSDIPRIALTEALRVPSVLAEQYGKQPARPIDVAAALNISPTSSTFRVLCGASVGYGLTDGGPNASSIGLTQTGQRIVAPLAEGEDVRALREAALTPSIMRTFLQKYDGSPLPTEKIGANVLEAMDVPHDAVERVFGLILANAEHVGFLKVIKDKTYVDLNATEAPAGRRAETTVEQDEDETEEKFSEESFELGGSVVSRMSADVSRNRKVFISHGKTRRVVDQLKELLNFGDFEPVVTVERESVSKPVPAKVLDDMRMCAAGIIHVKPEESLLDKEGNEQHFLNQNVLIEIGAAMALYRDHFILLVEDGATLPSNLQGLYEVRYSGDELGYEATMKVLKALNQFKSALP
jgi:Predicted nucleotide-binding protein containing TIR-like domain